MKTITYTLPSYWASYLINGDDSGLEPEERREIDEFWDREDIGACLDVSEDTWFAHTNDANNLGADVAKFTFALAE